MVNSRRGSGSLAATSAAVLVVAAAAAAPTVPRTTTAFACGARWTDARACAVICPAGDDDACPAGQRCYGGTSCRGGHAATLARQRRLEERAAEQLARRRDAEYRHNLMLRFVCGRSFAEAERSCGAAAAAYCDGGPSAQCPAGTECYAAVACPRPPRDEVPPSSSAQLSSLGSLPNSQMLNSTAPFSPEEDDLSEGQAEAAEAILEGGLFAGEPWSAMLGTASVRYGLN